jgi:hypothetical protein
MNARSSLTIALLQVDANLAALQAAITNFRAFLARMRHEASHVGR